MSSFIRPWPLSAPPPPPPPRATISPIPPLPRQSRHIREPPIEHTSYNERLPIWLYQYHTLPLCPNLHRRSRSASSNPTPRSPQAHATVGLLRHGEKNHHQTVEIGRDGQKDHHQTMGVGKGWPLSMMSSC
jgi:hypothetical protein